MKRTPLNRKTPLKAKGPVRAPRGNEGSAGTVDYEAIARALNNRQRSIELGSPEFVEPVAAPKPAPKSDGAFSKAVRDLILRRDQECWRCGSVGAYNLQHRVARGMGGTNDPILSGVTNGIRLCGSGTTGCHGWVEAHPFEAQQNGWAVQSWADPSTVPVLDSDGTWYLLDENGSAHGWPGPSEHSHEAAFRRRVE